MPEKQIDESKKKPSRDIREIFSGVPDSGVTVPEVVDPVKEEDRLEAKKRIKNSVVEEEPKKTISKEQYTRGVSKEVDGRAVKFPKRDDGSDIEEIKEPEIVSDLDAYPELDQKVTHTKERSEVFPDFAKIKSDDVIELPNNFDDYKSEGVDVSHDSSSIDQAQDRINRIGMAAMGLNESSVPSSNSRSKIKPQVGSKSNSSDEGYSTYVRSRNFDIKTDTIKDTNLAMHLLIYNNNIDKICYFLMLIGIVLLLLGFGL